MVRPRKDKFEETSIGFKKGTEHEIVHVSMPFWSKVTYKVKISEDNNGKAIYGTSDQIIRSLHQTKDEITKIFQKNGMIVITIEEATIRLPNICEKCHKKGIPRIEKKSNKTDYHYRVETHMTKTETDRPDEYWLIYDHKTEPKCRIAQYDKNHFLFKKPNNRISELHKHFYPFYLEHLELRLNNNSKETDKKESKQITDGHAIVKKELIV